MNITPLRRYRGRPVALLRAGHRWLSVITEDGIRTAKGSRDVSELLDKLTEYVCYAESGLSTFRYCTPATSWTLNTWRGRETRMRHNASGVEVTSLRGTLDGSEDPWGDLQRVLGWLRGYGVSPGSLSSMSWSLWRASLPGEISIGFDPDIGRAALYGGRQECSEPRIYQHMVSTDIRAAYPFAMAQTSDYSLSLREVSPETVLDPAVAGLAYATVIVPREMPYAPLPTRIAPQMIQFQWGTVRGTWPWVELHAAELLGAEVRVHRSWAPRRTADLFGSWWPMIEEGRALPGCAGTMAKSISNSLWGQFGMVGDDRAEVRWADPSGKVSYAVDLPERKMPHAWTAHIAAETTARVRSRIVSEALYASQFSPVHMDTDGIIVRKSSEVPLPAGDGPGEWRVKEQMRKVDLRAPQLYRFTCGRGCGVTHAEWHYVASGLSASQAPEFFRKNGSSTRISFMADFDHCLPPDHSDNIERRQAMIAEAVGLGAY